MNKSSSNCDIVENVYYNYRTVQSLLDVIQKLETQVSSSENSADSVESTQSNSVSLSHTQLNSIDQSKEQNSPQSNNTPSQLCSPHVDSTPGSTTGTKDKSTRGTTIEDISTEVGSLTISNNDSSQGKYIGAATGSNFAKLFLKQMHLSRLNEINTNLLDDFESFDSSVTKSYAPLPPFRIAKYAVIKYINSIHIYYPLLILQNLKITLHNMYTSPRDVSLNDKFILFIVISIGLDRSEKDPEITNYNNQFKPVEYFNTAYRYLEEILSNRSEKSLQSLLLIIIWLLNTNVLQDDNGDLWHLGRFSMSLAMELGVHRFNPDWDFGEMKNELRNRLFWCTYILERTIAMKFGRGLSLRKQAIDTPIPHLLKDDYVSDNTIFNPEFLNVYDQIQFKPSILLINICEIYGDMLETVYISRTEGSQPTMTNEEVFNSKIRLQNLLNKWMVQVENQIPNTLESYHELKIRYCITSIILNRPSPSFPTPDTDSILKCKKDSQACVESYNWLIERGWKINPTCLHDLVNVGLTMIYCCWKTETDAIMLKNFSVQTLRIMNEIIHYYPNFSKFKNLFIIVSSIIIDGFQHLETMNSDPETDRSMQNEFMFQNIPQQIQQVKASIQYPNANPTNNTSSNVEFNDWFTQELFQDVFRQYYFQNNDVIMEDLDHLFNYQN
ncbi:hypothetical protein C6P40_000725 [Pichia californica]|uniref:Xylanolytic transcriptional activator regulatory domain-containing protein n=1 Tax=Pichia californica TaxID=460514 RepID=A0A9P7BFZ5_9ASCO|nr:hypothetical protein C6P40_000725 [[Candida] californica]